jgi:hypothetical protein
LASRVERPIHLSHPAAADQALKLIGPDRGHDRLPRHATTPALRHCFEKHRLDEPGGYGHAARKDRPALLVGRLLEKKGVSLRG